MNSGFGDLARTVPLSRQGVEARRDMARLSQELTTGRHGDLAKATRGDLRAAVGIERNLAILASAETAAEGAQHRMSAMQAALDAVGEASGNAAQSFLTLSETRAASAAQRGAATAEAALGTVVSSLNARMGGIGLFSGIASDEQALPAADEMMSKLRTHVAGLAPVPATATDLQAAVRAWFAPGGGMDDGPIADGRDEPARLTVAPGDTLTVDATAADPEFRRLMADLATGVLAADMLGPEERPAAYQTLGTALLGDEAGLADAQSRLGIAEGHSERSLTRVRSEINALHMARAEVLEVDRYEAATKFQAAEAAVESLYLVTARLSALSFANYMR